MDGTVLTIGADENFRKAIDLLLMGAEVRSSPTVNQTEGLGVDVIVIASDRPADELRQVRVHPQLHDAPVVVVSPGRIPGPTHPSRGDTWVLTTTGWPLLEELTERIGWLISRRRHPTGGHPGLRAAS